MKTASECFHDVHLNTCSLYNPFNAELCVSQCENNSQQTWHEIILHVHHFLHLRPPSEPMVQSAPVARPRKVEPGPLTGIMR